MDLRPVSRAAEAVADAVVTRLRGSRGLLAIDEAQHLPVSTLEELRYLHDESGCGLALVGSVPLWARLSGGRHPDLAQMYSRIGRRLYLGRPAAGDVRALLGAWGLAGNGLEAAADAVAERSGTLRELTKTITVAHLVAKGAPVQAAHLRAAWLDRTGESLRPARGRGGDGDAETN